MCFARGLPVTRTTTEADENCFHEIGSLKGVKGATQDVRGPLHQFLAFHLRLSADLKIIRFDISLDQAVFAFFAGQADAVFHADDARAAFFV